MAEKNSEIQTENGNLNPELARVMSVDSQAVRLGLRRDLTAVPREQFKESLEGGFKVHREFYESGNAAGGSDQLKEVQKDKPDAVIASVDSDGFPQIWREPDWYREYLVAARELSNLYEVLDSDSRAWFDDLKPVIDGFVALEGLSSRDFNRKYKNEIWKLTVANGNRKIYGPRGALNFLLAYNRAKNVYPTIADAEPGELVLKLVMGEGSGDKAGAKDRFASTAVKVVKADDGGAVIDEPVRRAAEPELAAGKREAEVAVGEAGSEQPELPTEEAKQPEFMSTEFYKQFGIEDPADVESFVGYYDGFRPLLGQIEDLKSPDYWTNLDKADKDSLYGKGKADGYWFQAATLEEFRTGFESFWKSGHSEAIELRELNFWLLKRLIEYSSGDGQEQVTDDGYEILCKKLVDSYEGVDVALMNDKTLLAQLVDAAHYLAKNDVLDPDSWARKEVYYQELLSKI